MSFFDLQLGHRRKSPLLLLLAGVLILSLLLSPRAGLAAKKNKPRPKAKPTLKTKAIPKPKKHPRVIESPQPLWFPDEESTGSPSCPHETLLHAQANEFLGTPYRIGGASKSGTDCSGLVKQIFLRVYGIELPHSSSAQSRLSMMEQISENELQPGDLIFFGPGKKRINHVGVYLADGKFLHASRKVGVTVSDLDESYWRRRLISYKRPLGAETDGEAARPATLSGEIVSAFGAHPVDARRREWSTAFRQDLLPETIDLRLGAFIEAHDGVPGGGWRSPADSDPEWSAQAGGFSPEQRLSQGLRLASAIRPFDWLQITPSLSVVDRMNDADSGHSGPLRVLAIEALMHPLDSPWTLAMATRATSGGQPPAADGDPNRQNDHAGSLDLSLGLRYSFSNALSLSLTGTRDTYRDNYDTAVAHDSRDTGRDDLSLQLDFRF
jgi:cell wall-associated NlpC family hydrolase